ncbi:hypothetical protein WA1_37435 [Scytonema hofmannii PCC 7110]|uniref:Uncharacterized protein n=1 Tax=Scytonema hofmannii PCC 7110 TaxID=128403 RepID=A0A139X082_9CYAN|nr:DUF6174 domain-containing protein [Scytonema hofmannii]KYC38043.1 hypothetical protein WA1_37435 [Scytonema hofmannii PCC 7110]
MRLPVAIAIGMGIMLSLSSTTPVLSEPFRRPTQSSAANNLDLRRLRFNQNLWNERNIVNYRYTLSNSCFCIPDARGPVIIEVRNGQTTSITSVETGQPVSNPEFFQQYDTIPKLFNVIQDAIKRRAESVNAQYNAKFGYPTQISIDYSAQIADEEVYLTIENFAEIR